MILELFSDMNPVVTKILVAIMILLLGFMAGKLIGVILLSLFKELQIDKAIKIFSGLFFSFSKFLSETISVSIYIISFVMALNTLGIINIVLQIFLGFAIIVILGAVILSLIGFMPNLYGGIMLKSQKKFLVGNSVKIKTAKGTISKIKMLKIFIKTKEGDTITVRNWTAFKNMKKIQL